MLHQCKRLFTFGKSLLGISAVAAVTSFAAPAQAGMTQVLASPHATEQSQSQIFSHYYGGLFTANGDSFTNGAVTATRIDDNVDAAWTGNALTLTPVASFSRSDQSLGLLLGKTGGSYEHLLTVDQFGYLSGSPTTLNLGANAWRFTLDNSITQLSTSSASTTGDQLVTYKIDGLSGGSRYVLFWEDTPLQNSDRDYNDLVLEASFAGNGGPMAVPLPPAALLGLTTLGGTGVVAWFKKRKLARTAA